MLRVLVACGAGMGSSQLLKMNVEKVFKELNVVITIHHCEIDEARSSAKNYDVLICNDRFIETIQQDILVIGLKNIMDKKEIKNKILAAGIGNE